MRYLFQFQSQSGFRREWGRLIFMLVDLRSAQEQDEKVGEHGGTYSHIRIAPPGACQKVQPPFRTVEFDELTTSEEVKESRE